MFSASIGAGTTLVAGGNVVVGNGISGRSTRVVARGAIRVGWVEDARVRAGGDILIGSHATRATIHADGVVRVERSEGPKGGVICGGDIWEFSGIQTQVAGSNAYNMTNLTAGMDPEGAKKLDLLNRKLEEGNKLILRHLSRFQMQRRDVAAIQKRLAASTGPQKKVLTRAARPASAGPPGNTQGAQRDFCQSWLNSASRLCRGKRCNVPRCHCSNRGQSKTGDVTDEERPLRNARRVHRRALRQRSIFPGRPGFLQTTCLLLRYPPQLLGSLL